MAGRPYAGQGTSWWSTLLSFLATVGALVLLNTWYNHTGRLSQNASMVAEQLRTRQLSRGSPSTGRVFSWSVDGSRQALGREDGEAGLPGPVPGLPSPVVSVAAAGHSLAVTAGGLLYSWGRNDSKGGGGGGSRGIPDAGQLGVPRQPQQAEIPGQLLLPDVKFVAAAAGRYHSVALDDAGKVYTFGLNDFAQLGRPGPGGCVGGATCHDPRPIAVKGLPPAVAIAAGRYHSLALTAAGEVWTWGLNLCGRPELVEQAVEARLPPAKLALVMPQRVRGGGLEKARIVGLDAGYVHWVALADDGSVWTCDTGFDGYGGSLRETQKTAGWRMPNKDGELGRPVAKGANASAGLMPGRVPGLLASAVAAGRCFTLAASRQSGEIMQWGCGVGGRKQANEPQALAGVGAGQPNGAASALAAGEWAAAVATEAGRLLVWGVTGKQQHETAAEPVEARGLPQGHVTALSAAHQHFLAVVDGSQRGKQRQHRPTQEQLQHQASKQRAQRHGQGRGQDATATERHKQQPSDGGSVGGTKGAATAATSQQAAGASSSGSSRGGGTASSNQEAAAQHARDAEEQQQQQAQQPAGEAPEVTADIRRAAPDIFNELAPFEQRYRNPCFRHRATGALRCLPYFSIIGVSKAGTTDLHRKLMLLPGFKESRNKGPHFWDEPHPFDWYLALYDDVAAAVQKDSQVVTCDASSNTFTYSGVGIRGKKVEGVLLPQVLRAVQPEMKLIVMLRDPVERMYSAFWYYGCLYGIYKAHGMSAEGFHRFAQDQVQLLWRCQEQKDARLCALTHYNDAQQLVKGLYAVFLPDWLKHYPREQILFINFEKYVSSEREHLLRVLAFLDLPAPSDEALELALAAQANRGHRANPNVPGCTAPRADMLPDTRRLLADFYRPYNEQLAKQLGDDSYRWGPARR